MKISKDRLDEIAAIPDTDIDTSDIPEVGQDFCADVILQMPDDTMASSPAH